MWDLIFSFSFFIINCLLLVIFPPHFHSFSFFSSSRSSSIFSFVFGLFALFSLITTTRTLIELILPRLIESSFDLFESVFTCFRWYFYVLFGSMFAIQQIDRVNNSLQIAFIHLSFTLNWDAFGFLLFILCLFYKRTNHFFCHNQKIPSKHSIFYLFFENCLCFEPYFAHLNSKLCLQNIHRICLLWKFMWFSQFPSCSHFACFDQNDKHYMQTVHWHSLISPKITFFLLFFFFFIKLMILNQCSASFCHHILCMILVSKNGSNCGRIL